MKKSFRVEDLREKIARRCGWTDRAERRRREAKRSYGRKDTEGLRGGVEVVRTPIIYRSGG